jgi:glycerol-3-phosphate O-acyltransferase / dihydroxyacetone phosphate acyltransferase
MDGLRSRGYLVAATVARRPAPARDLAKSWNIAASKRRVHRNHRLLPMWLLPLLGRVGSLATRSYYRFHDEGERVPCVGPVLLVANHPNSLFDPALVVASAGRPVRFLAKEPLIHHPGIGWLIRGSGAIPIYRMSDDPASFNRNDETFRAAHDALAEGAAIGMFPEGISHDLPGLAPLKSGAARLALGAARELGRDFPIIPVGLTFRGKEHFRSEALALVGRRLEWRDLIGERYSPAATRELTRRIAEALREQTVELRSWSDAPIVQAAAAINAAESGDPDRPPVRLRLEREIGAALERLGPEESRELVDEVDEHARTLRSLGLKPGDLQDSPPLRRAAGRFARHLVVLGALGFLGVLGHAIFLVPAHLVQRSVARLEPTPDIRSTYLTLGGALFGSTWTVLLALLAGFTLGIGAAVAVFVTAPLLELAAVVFRDQWGDARAVARGVVVLGSRRAVHADLAR